MLPAVFSEFCLTLRIHDDDTKGLQVSGIARVEMSMVEMTGMTDQLRAEISHRLDSVEDHLRARVVVAEADSAEAEALVGIHEMSPPALESALVRATAVRYSYFNNYQNEAHF